MKKRWSWWLRLTCFLEAYLVGVMAGWAINLFVTDLFNSNTLYRVMGETATQQTWGLLLVCWLVLYGFVVYNRWDSGRVLALILSAGWWATITVMIYQSSPVSTGVAAYGPLAVLSSAAALYNVRYIKRGG